MRARALSAAAAARRGRLLQGRLAARRRTGSAESAHLGLLRLRGELRPRRL